MGKKCFIITPIGEKNSEIFRHIQGIINAVIKPLLMTYDFDDIKAAHEIDEPGSINNQLINRILEDDLVIANLTGNNANVMYELAIRHSTAKPIIHICEDGTKLPFDIINERTIFYTNDIMGTIELREGIKRFLDNMDFDRKYYDNPIYNAKQRALLIENVAQDNPMKVAVELIEDMRKDISREISSIRKEMKPKGSTWVNYTIDDNKVRINGDDYSNYNSALSEVANLYEGFNNNLNSKIIKVKEK